MKDGNESPESGSLYSDEIPSGYNSGEQYDTGKSLSEALFIAEHVVYKNCSECQKQFLYTQHVLPRYELGIFM